MKFPFFNRFSEKLTKIMKQFVFGSSSQNVFPSTFPNHRISSIDSNRFKTCLKIRNNFLQSRDDKMLDWVIISRENRLAWKIIRGGI